MVKLNRSVERKAKMVESGIPIGQWSGSDATNALRESIEKFNQQSTRQADTMLRLTWVIAALTIIMAIGLGVQIWLSLRASC
jgi:hypothetical protein